MTGILPACLTARHNLSSFSLPRERDPRRAAIMTMTWIESEILEGISIQRYFMKHLTSAWFVVWSSESLVVASGLQLAYPARREVARPKDSGRFIAPHYYTDRGGVGFQKQLRGVVMMIV